MAWFIGIVAFVVWGLIFAAGCCKGINDDLNKRS